MSQITLTVNGAAQPLELEPDMPLLYALRNHSEPQRRQVRLRPGPVRRVHGDRRRPAGVRLPDAVRRP